jgi:hypothetical protein
LIPNCPLAWICSYFLFSTVVVLLHVVLLSKVFGNVFSAERSLILFICNVVQLIFTFSIWYELIIKQTTKGEALLKALLVFATLGYPPEAGVIVGLQIATDFLLLAIFLAHIVGRVGYRICHFLGVGDYAGPKFNSRRRTFAQTQWCPYFALKASSLIVR